MTASLSVHGTKELAAAMQRLSSAVAGRLGDNAVRAAARVIVAKAQQTSAFHDETGATRRSYRVFRRLDRGAGSRTAYAGSAYFVARFLEYGTQRMAARPALRKALDEGGQAAVDRMLDNLATGILREIGR
jgi:HK97 gp10 family phage protein